jgi:hypothetical protein
MPQRPSGEMLEESYPHVWMPFLPWVDQSGGRGNDRDRAWGGISNTRAV